MIRSIIRSLQNIRPEDIKDKNVHVLQGINKIPTNIEEYKKQFKFRK